MTHKELQQQTLGNLRRGLLFLHDSSEEAAMLVIGMHITALGVLRRHKYLTVDELMEEMRTLYVAVEETHPGKWEAFGGPRLPDTLKA